MLCLLYLGHECLVTVMVDTMPILCLLQFIMQIMVFIAFLSDYVLQLDIAHMSKPLSVCLLS